MQKYIANQDTKILYTYPLGGGIKGRTVKKGDIITKTGEMTDIDTVSVCTAETLRRIVKSYFEKVFDVYDPFKVVASIPGSMGVFDTHLANGMVITGTTDETQAEIKKLKN